jgi:hypothetical protein
MSLAIGILASFFAQDTDVAARIDGAAIRWAEVDERMNLNPAAITPEIRRAKLREVVVDRLIAREAAQCDLNVSDQELDEFIDREMKRYPDKEEFEKALRVMNVTKAKYREDLRRSFLQVRLLRHLILHLLKNVPDAREFGFDVTEVKPEEIKAYYEKHREEFQATEHITAWRIGMKFSGEEEKKQKRKVLESALRKLDQGSDFYILAAYTSEVGPDTKSGRSIFGHWQLCPKDSPYTKGTNALLFKTLKEGETSGIVEDGNTLNLFHLIQRVNLPAQSLEDARERIAQVLNNEKREQNLERMRRELIRRAKIEPADLFKD